MNRLRAVFLAPSWAIMLALFLAPLAIIACLQPAHPRRLRRRRTALDPRKLHAPGRSALPRHPAAFLLDRRRRHRSLPRSSASRWRSSSRAPGRRKNLYLSLVILPFWTSFLVRTYAWMFLLRDTGLINTVLQKLGLIHEPLPLLYNDGAVILGLVYGYLPFMVLPLYATLERLDPTLLEAAADLGARPWQTLFRVIIPLSAPGIRAGAVLVFIPCLGAYLTPDLLGGGKTVMIGNLIQNQFTTARDWPFGSAVSLAADGHRHGAAAGASSAATAEGLLMNRRSRPLRGAAPTSSCTCRCWF